MEAPNKICIFRGLKGTSILVMVCEWGLILGADGFGLMSKEEYELFYRENAPDEGQLRGIGWSQNFARFKATYEPSSDAIKNMYESINARQMHLVLSRHEEKVFSIGKKHHILFTGCGEEKVTGDMRIRLDRMANDYFNKNGTLLPIKNCIDFCHEFVNLNLDAETWNMPIGYDMSDFNDAGIILATYEFEEAANAMVPRVVYVDRKGPEDISEFKCIGQGDYFASSVLAKLWSFTMDQEEAKTAAREALQAASLCLFSGGMAKFATMDSNHAVTMYNGTLEFTIGGLPLPPLEQIWDDEFVGPLPLAPPEQVEGDGPLPAETIGGLPLGPLEQLEEQFIGPLPLAPGESDFIQPGTLPLAPPEPAEGDVPLPHEEGERKRKRGEGEASGI